MSEKECFNVMTANAFIFHFLRLQALIMFVWPKIKKDQNYYKLKFTEVES